MHQLKKKREKQHLLTNTTPQRLLPFLANDLQWLFVEYSNQ